MDKFTKVLTQMQIGCSWYLWKISLIPFTRTYFKNKYEEHKKELKHGI